MKYQIGDKFQDPDIATVTYEITGIDEELDFYKLEQTFGFGKYIMNCDEQFLEDKILFEGLSFEIIQKAYNEIMEVPEKDLQPALAKSGTNCSHPNKYINKATRTHFWICPDCGKDLGDA